MKSSNQFLIEFLKKIKIKPIKPKNKDKDKTSDDVSSLELDKESIDSNLNNKSTYFKGNK